MIWDSRPKPLLMTFFLLLNLHLQLQDLTLFFQSNFSLLNSKNNKYICSKIRFSTF
ncbi:hypothetical protein ERO13_D13G165766v2 [Gossypium hirsutum]|uniref:Uncharacterized protein n=1 Tax=Gossypium darwinii TaxID=34276 RepID=A0A5D1ZZY1_GOSDA|nr:hypothetical protein ERO13_D13G165766v2 [Gossypium hirsutum]TYG38174.1 hypothetical protein ES288_D13G200700v1 [Gossypium darwinii]